MIYFSVFSPPSPYTTDCTLKPSVVPVPAAMWRPHAEIKADAPDCDYLLIVTIWLEMEASVLDSEATMVHIFVFDS